MVAENSAVGLHGKERGGGRCGGGRRRLEWVEEKCRLKICGRPLSGGCISKKIGAGPGIIRAAGDEGT